MKFEINDKTGMIEADNQGFDEYWPADAKDLEAILQAVKKTQEKLVNKQIQKIQDSKNIPFPEIKNPVELKKFVKEELKRHEKIEQNQKIVDIVQKWYDQVLDDLSVIVDQGGKDYDMLNLQNKLCAILEGKYIKDLSL